MSQYIALGCVTASPNLLNPKSKRVGYVGLRYRPERLENLKSKIQKSIKEVYLG